MTPDRNQNDVLNAACYYVIEKYREKTGEHPSGIHFNKFLSILNKETGDGHSPLALPHSWYRWGDEVARLHMPTALRWNHEEPPFTTVGWEGDVPSPPDGVEVFERIEALTERLIDEYASQERLRDLIGRVYSYAPFPFQNAYRELRETYLDIKGATMPVDEIQEAVVMPALGRALDVYPWDDFPEFGRNVNPFRILMESLVKQGVEAMGLAMEASETFWFAFCYHLRLHPRAHENIPHSTIEYWRAGLNDQMHHYEVAVDSLLLEAAESHPRIRKDAAVDKLVTAAERREAEGAEILRAFEEEAEDLGKFLNKMREMRQAVHG